VRSSKVTPGSLRDEPISSGDGYAIEQWRAGRTLVVTGRWTEEAATALRQGKADGLVLNHAHGFSEGTLDFLPDGVRVRRLDLLHRDIADLSPLARLGSSLSELSIQPHPEAELDLSDFTALRSVAGDWALIGPTIASVAELESVVTWQFTESDLHVFRDHFDLRRLTLKEAPYLESLSGIGGLPALSSLWIQFAPGLYELAELAAIAASLRELRLENCRRVDTLDEMTELTELTFLEVGDCGDLESLSPLARLRDLEELYLWGTTRIADGNLTPLTELPKLRDLRIMNRRTYKPSLDEIKAQLQG
jgi:Leucine-rich repeat (LRR) protein